MQDDRVDELVALQRRLAVIRAVGAPFALAQVLTFYRPYPPGMRDLALVFVAVLAVNAAVTWWASAAVRGLQRVRWFAVGGIALDLVAAMGLTVAYTFDPETVVWIVLYLLPLEGAALFGMRGALWTMAAAALGYTAREVYGQAVWDVDLLPVSITFRMGVGVMMAVVVGGAADQLRRERDRLRELTEELRRRGDDLAAANTELEGARRAQMEFVALTNHELRTPLTAIKGFALTLTRRWDAMPDDARRTAVEAIEQQARRLEDLVSDLLTVSAIRAGQLAIRPGQVVLAPVIAEAAGLAGVAAEIRCPEGLAVRADRARLLQVLVNLLGNARKHGRPPVEVSVRRRGDRVLVEVADRGPGVPADFAPRMFEEFTQASEGETRVAGGHGLGLAVVRYLVTALGGTVAYRDRQGGGALLVVELPAGDRDAAPGRQDGRTSSGPPLSAP